MPTREVFCGDALLWLPKHKGKLDCVIASLPEMEELGLTAKTYESWFRDAAKLCLEAVKEDGYCIFLQTDRKHHGLIDKQYLVTDEAYTLSFHTVWKKIALKREVGKTDLYRPTYSHMTCFTKKGKIGKPIPDVVEAGETTYTHAFGVNAVALCINYAKEVGVKTVVDPFCGSGTTLAVANAFGLHAIGVELDKKRCAQAKKLELDME
jgi:hypothetical protein